MKNTVSELDDLVKIRNVLISVSDKTGLETFIPALIAINPDIRFYSTGGTYRKLIGILGNSDSNLVSVSEYTGQPEMQGGLVKTLDFKIYLGLLSETYNSEHRSDLERTGAVEMDMVIVNLYPFQKTIESPDTNPENARSNIDIGGPCMLRASAKNFLRVASVCDPFDYDKILHELKNTGGGISFKMRFMLARKTFAHTAEYDNSISSYLNKIGDDEAVETYSFQEKG